ncbi:MAG: hypothetical protein KDB73_19830, partial [Planctomycetes bacterium]|nr:hypothetical protein [Planctomycetota bacterium]
MHEFAAGLLGALLHPQPRCALVVGYGTGGAVRALAAAGCKRIAATDDEPAWLHYVAAGNTGELAPAVRTLAALSPRGALRGARDLGGGPCDVVIGAASPLARGGHADVLTRPAYEELQGALAPGGVAVLCLDADDFDANDLESVAAAFAGTFPGGLAWAADDKLVLVGRRDVPCEIDGERWESMLAGGSLRDAAGRLGPGGLASGLVHLPAPAEAVDARSRPSVAPRAGRLGWEVASRRLRRSATGARAWLAALPPDVASLYRPGPVNGDMSEPPPGERWGRELESSWHQAGRDVSSPEVQELLARQPRELSWWALTPLLTPSRAEEALAEAERWRAMQPDSTTLADRVAALAIGMLPASEEHRAQLRALHAAHDMGRPIQSDFADAMERQGAPAEAAEWLRAHLDVMPADSQQPGSRARLAALWMKAGPPTDERRAQAYAWLRADPVTYKSAKHFRLLLETRPADATDGPDEADERRALAALQRKEARSNIERAQRTWSLGKLDEALDAARRAT